MSGGTLGAHTAPEYTSTTGAAIIVSADSPTRDAMLLDTVPNIEAAGTTLGAILE